MKNKKKIILIILPILLVVISIGYIMLTKVNFTKLLGSVNPMDLKSSDVPYTNNSQSTVQGAIDDLYTKANTYIDPSYIDFTTLETNNKKTILVSKNGVCIKRNNKVSCFKVNNYSVEKDHIQQVFSDARCSFHPDSVGCYDSDFLCVVNSNGSVDCRGASDYSGCSVSTDGSVDCY